MRILIVIILMLLCALAHAQTHTMPGSNVVPSGASLTINSGASITAAAGSTVTGFGSGGGGAPTTATYVTQTPDGTLSAEFALSTLATGLLKSTTTTGALTTITDNSTNWNTAFTQTRQWDGGSTGLVAATGRTSLALVIGTNVEAWDADLDTWAGITPGTGVGTFLATPTSANLRGALTDENGTGAALFDAATSPAFTTPKVTTGIWDANGNVMLGFTPTASAVNNLTMTNSATSTVGGTIVAAGTGTNLDVSLFAKGTGAVKVGAAANSFNVYSAYAGNADVPAGVLAGSNTGNYSFFPGASSPAAGNKLVFGYWNGTGRSAVEVANVSSGDGTLLLMKGGGVIDIGSTDTGIFRNAAGVIEINNGTAGTFKDLKANNVNAVTAFQINGTAETSVTQTLTNKRVNPRVTSIASNATWSPSADTDDVYEITAQTAAVTVISNPTGTPVDGQSLIIRFSDNGTARALTWSGTQWQAGPGLALPTSTIVGNHDYVGFKWNSTTSKWTMVASTQLNGTVDDTAYASSWNGVTGIGPSKNAIYDELHLIDTADNGTIVNAGTGFTVAGVAPINYELTGNGTNFVSKASDIPNGSSAQQTGFSANTYLAGSVITISAGDFKVGSTYRCMFDMTKTTAGTAAPVITIYIGTAGSTADTSAQTITFAAATGVADTGMFEVWVNFRAVGASATISSVGRCVHNLAITGLTSTGASGSGTVSNSTSSTFNSTAMTKIGVAFNGGASYVGTNNIVQAYYSNP